MIMGARAVIKHAPNQGATVPVIMGSDDSVIMFRRRLLVTECDGVELRSIFDRMASRHPGVAARVTAAGSLGEIMYSRAIASLETYRDTGVAVAPVSM